jgi:hypothetical protein
MEFNKETLNLFRQKLSIILVNIFPGILILELFFKKGFLSDNISNLYSFIIYLVWGFSLSIMVNFLLNISISYFLEKKVKPYFNRKNKEIPNNLYKEIYPDGIGIMEYIDEYESTINIIFFCIFFIFVYAVKTLVIYLINKYTILPTNYVINYIIRNDILSSCIVFIFLFIFKNFFQNMYFTIIFYKELKEYIKEIRTEYDV